MKAMYTFERARDVFERTRDSYIGRKYLYLFPRTGETYCAVNYDAVNNELNTFISRFDVWGPRSGQNKLSDDGNHSEMWFEVPEEFYNLCRTNRMFIRAIESFGVKIVFDYPFKSDFDKLKEEHERMAKAAEMYMNGCFDGPNQFDF